MLFLDFCQFSLLSGYELLPFRDDLSTAGAGFEGNRRLLGMLRLPPTVVFLHSGVAVVVVVGIIPLLLILDIVVFTI